MSLRRNTRRRLSLFFFYTTLLWPLHTFKNYGLGDFACGPVVKNLVANAGDTCSIPGPGTKTPCAVEQLSLQATSTEPSCCNYWGWVPWSPRSTAREASTRRSLCPAAREWPPLITTRESLCTARKTQNSINQYIRDSKTGSKDDSWEHPVRRIYGCLAFWEYY